jgi:hypothetical protein
MTSQPSFESEFFGGDTRSLSFLSKVGIETDDIIDAGDSSSQVAPSSPTRRVSTSSSAPTSPYRLTYHRHRSATRGVSQKQLQSVGSNDNKNNSSSSNSSITPATSPDSSEQSNGSFYADSKNLDSTATKYSSNRSVNSNASDQESQYSYKKSNVRGIADKNGSLNSLSIEFSEEKKTQNEVDDEEVVDNPIAKTGIYEPQQMSPQSPTQLHVRGVGPVIQDDDSDQIDEMISNRRKVTSVLYNDGATPLFKAIEEQDWKKVESICTNEPHQASIWVVSTGTVQTTFNWSLWKRLPIHELCRRNPTVQAMYCVINAYPDGCRSVTQFGELPLHLAIECGASSMIVTALITANWRGVFQCDQVGRTPMDVFRDTEVLLDHTEYMAVQNVFELSTRTHNEIQSEQENEIALLRQKHDILLQATHEQHHKDLAVEHEHHDKLEEEIIGLDKIVQTLKMKVTEQNNVIQHNGTIQQQRELDYHTLFAEKDKYKYELQKSVEQNDSLQVLIGKYQHQLTNANEQIVQLQNALKDVVQYQSTVLQQQSERTTARLELALRSYNDMTDAIDDHADHLKSVLNNLVTPIPPPPSLGLLPTPISPSTPIQSKAQVSTASTQSPTVSSSPDTKPSITKLSTTSPNRKGGVS